MNRAIARALFRRDDASLWCRRLACAPNRRFGPVGAGASSAGETPAPQFPFVASLIVGSLVATFAQAAANAADATATRLDGTIVVGLLLTASADAIVLGPTGERPDPIELPTAELLSLDLPATAAPLLPASVVECANGDRLAAEVIAAEEDAVTLRRAGGEMLTIPSETIRGILFKPVEDDDGFPLAVLRPTGADDLVALTNGDRLAGRFVGLDAATLTLDAGGKEVTVPRDRLTGLAFSPELTAAAKIDGPGMIVQAADGWLSVSGLARRPDGSWRAATAFGAAATWPAGTVRRVLFTGGRRTLLANLEPESFRHTPFAGPTLPLRRNRDATGRPLAAGGIPFASGLGTHSRGRVEYRLDGGFVRLYAVVGLSPSAGAVGSAVFAVDADGREVFRSGDVTAADPAVPIDVDLTGVQTLTLRVEYGRNGDVLDRANWCDAVLVRQ